jgi:hypothetical protein
MSRNYRELCDREGVSLALRDWCQIRNNPVYTLDEIERRKAVYEAKLEQWNATYNRKSKHRRVSSREVTLL